MEEKEYPIFEEEGSFGCDCVNEPVGAAVRTSVDDNMYGIDDWPGMPLVGPVTIDEANSRIDQAEQEIDNDKGMDWEVFKSLLKSKHTSASYAI